MKWKCSVCRHISEQEEKPKHCPECKADTHKIKGLYFKPRRKSHADEPEDEH